MRTFHPRRALIATAVMLASAALLPAVPAGAVNIGHSSVASENPSGFTPNIIDGRVNAMMVMNGMVYVGGTFHTVQNAGVDHEHHQELRPRLQRDLGRRQHLVPADPHRSGRGAGSGTGQHLRLYRRELRFREQQHYVPAARARGRHVRCDGRVVHREPEPDGARPRRTQRVALRLGRVRADRRDGSFRPRPAEHEHRCGRPVVGPPVHGSMDLRPEKASSAGCASVGST